LSYRYPFQDKDRIIYFSDEKNITNEIRKKSNDIEKDTSGFMNLEIPIRVSIFRKDQHPWEIDSIGISNNK
jgi:hypothetical protein